MIIDATDLVVGRLATTAAKQALLGEKVDIVNCEKAVISGSRPNILAKYKQKRNRATVAKGPYLSKMPDRFIRRIIRGMLPYKNTKGELAFERVMCYIGVPSDLQGKKFDTIKNASIHTKELVKYMTVADLCQELGFGNE
jgi:large subunit ribosomal protein L13